MESVGTRGGRELEGKGGARAEHGRSPGPSAELRGTRDLVHSGKPARTRSTDEL